MIEKKAPTSNWADAQMTAENSASQGKPDIEIAKKNEPKWALPVNGLVLALVTAILTGAVGYFYGVANDIRKNKLDYVNAQIEKLYGPLYAATQANAAIWELFTNRHWRNQEANDDGPHFFDDRNPPTVSQVRRWRHWMGTVFQPLNVKMEEAIVANSHLLVGDTVPPPFRELIAHTEAYKAIIAAWGSDDFVDCGLPAQQRTRLQPCAAVMTVRNTAGLNYPETLAQCVADDYVRLKQRQQRLQGGFIAALFVGNLERSPTCSIGSAVARGNPESPTTRHSRSSGG